jgi:hypothetical protein
VPHRGERAFRGRGGRRSVVGLNIQEGFSGLAAAA